MKKAILLLTAAAAAFGVGALIGAVLGVAEIVRQEYFHLRLHRNALLVFSDHVLRTAFLGAAAAAFIAAAAAVARRTRFLRDREPVLIGFSASAALGIVLGLGWPRNRYVFAHIWRSRDTVWGLELPGGFTSARVWEANLKIIVLALIGGTALYLLLRAGRAIIDPYRARPPLRVVLIAAAAAGFLTAGFSAAGDRLLFGGRIPSGPNVILISLDTLRADFLGCYGCRFDTSPGLNRLAAESVLFENAYSQAPNTVPSHASFLTSRYPSVNRAGMRGSVLPKRRVLCPEIFREAGYRTLGIVDAFFLSGRFGFEQGYDRFEGWGRRARNIVPKAIDWLDGKGRRPVFLFVHIFDIHSPYAQDPPYKRMFVEGEYGGAIRPEGNQLGSYCQSRIEGIEPPFLIDEEDARHLRALYAGGIRYVDDVLVRLTDHIRGSGLEGNTLLVLTADHGEEFLEHGNVLHAELYRTVTHVPLLFRLPRGEGGGRRIEMPVGLIDLLPTLLDLTGLESPVPMSGRSLAPLVRGAGTVPFRPVFSEFDDNPQIAVRDKEYHLVAHLREDRWELFHVPTDPLEKNDRYAEERCVADSLRNMLLEWRARVHEEVVAEGGRPREIRLRVEEVEMLRALGYIR